jgi:hypothetical protein
MVMVVLIVEVGGYRSVQERASADRRYEGMQQLSHLGLHIHRVLVEQPSVAGHQAYASGA